MVTFKPFHLWILGSVLYLICTLLSANTPALLEQLKNENVVDTTNTLNSSEIARLKIENEAIYDKQKLDIKILFIPTTQGQSIEEYSNQVFNTLEIGDKHLDNGLLIVVAKNDRKMRIEVGRGLEGEVTDLFAGRIIRNVMTPAFQKDLYFQGLTQAQKQLSLQVREPVPDYYLSYLKSKEEKKETSIWVYISFSYIVISLTIAFYITFEKLFYHEPLNPKGQSAVILYCTAIYALAIFFFSLFSNAAWYFLIILTIVFVVLSWVQARSSRVDIDQIQSLMLRPVLFYLPVLGIFVIYFNRALGFFILMISFAPMFAVIIGFFGLIIRDMIGRTDLFPKIEIQDDEDFDPDSSGSSHSSSNNRSSSRSTTSRSRGRSSGGSSGGGGASGSW